MFEEISAFQKDEQVLSFWLTSERLKISGILCQITLTSILCNNKNKSFHFNFVFRAGNTILKNIAKGNPRT